MSRAKHTPEAIQRVIDAAHAGADWTAVANFIGINKRTAWDWVARARNTDNLTAPTPHRGGFRHRKITTVHIDFLSDRIADDCNLTLKEMEALFDDEFSVTMSPETVRRSLIGACFTLKKTHRDNDYRNSLVNKKKRHQYVVEIYH
uniref:Uncharacterized protein AlNc14C92G5730 n=1 Tax=Albugo laibachii Nc14 TaxID=890382 RepID=F0WGK1_9STRA|nr:conserved hypothetical protein [Albugo laibachii Nc14]|eukprot:CCA20365.1 conserved hypothetical protein [Albugo laibachii Nc14]